MTQDARHPEDTAVDVDAALHMVESVAEENEYRCHRSGNALEVWIERYHGAAFMVRANTSNYLEVKPWSGPGDDDYGRATLSVRSHSDLAAFTTMLVTMASLRARRRDSD